MQASMVTLVAVVVAELVSATSSATCLVISLVVAEAEAQGYTPVQAHEFAMRLTFYTESVVQTVADTYENYVQQPE